MPENNAQLIQQITEQVLALLHQNKPAVPGNGAAPVDIHPPAGVCTGDYSKFAEPRPKSREKAGEKDPACSGSSHDQPTVTLKGFVTARQLEAVGAKLVNLAPGAKLTPAGADYVRDRKIKVERAAAKSACGCGGTCCGKSGGGKKPATPGQWAWWIDGHCPGVDQVVPQYGSSLAPIAARRQSSGLVEACGTLAQRIARGKVAGGVLFVRSAALAACFANRCPSVRAVVGTCTGAVEQGVKQLGANVLIVEYPYHGPESMRQMIDTFVKTPRPALSQVERQLKELGRCV
jgi:ribose 5-phosphate isomerase RpiB